jgi:hypothetical protein
MTTTLSASEWMDPRDVFVIMGVDTCPYIAATTNVGAKVCQDLSQPHTPICDRSWPLQDGTNLESLIWHVLGHSLCGAQPCNDTTCQWATTAPSHFTSETEIVKEAAFHN